MKTYQLKYKKNFCKTQDRKRLIADPRLRIQSRKSCNYNFANGCLLFIFAIKKKKSNLAINYGICCLICGQLLKVNETLRFELLTYIKWLNDINQIPFVFLCYYMIRFMDQKKESKKPPRQTGLPQENKWQTKKKKGDGV